MGSLLNHFINAILFTAIECQLYLKYYILFKNNFNVANIEKNY